MWCQLSWVYKQSGDLTHKLDTQCFHAEKFVDLVTSLTKKNVTFYPPNSPNTCHSILHKVIIVASHENTIFALGPENSLSTCKIQTKHCKVAATKVKVFIAKLKLKAKTCFHMATIFSGMNIHLPAILFTRGTRF